MFKKKRKLFITIQFDEWPGLLDYPKDLPIPRIGEFVRLKNDAGRVKEVRHMTEGSVTEIRIECEEI